MGKRDRELLRLNRLRDAGHQQLLIWIPGALREAIGQFAAEHGLTLNETGTRIPQAGLGLQALFTPTDTRGSTAKTPSPVSVEKEAPATRAERDRRILELHRQGVSGREIARRVGCGETTVRKILKQVAAAATG